MSSSQWLRRWPTHPDLQYPASSTLDKVIRKQESIPYLITIANVLIVQAPTISGKIINLHILDEARHRADIVGVMALQTGSKKADAVPLKQGEVVTRVGASREQLTVQLTTCFED